MKLFIKHAWFSAVAVQEPYLAYELGNDKHEQQCPPKHHLAMSCLVRNTSKETDARCLSVKECEKKCLTNAK